jgi:hypothetical protein
MSSEEMATQMRPLINEFFRRLKHLATTNCDQVFGFANSKGFYKTAFDLARHMHIYPNYRDLFTDEDKKAFKEEFPIGFIILIGYTPGMVNNIEDCDMNIAKTKLSEMTFLKNEIFELYKQFSGDDVKLSSNKEISMTDLDDFIEKTLDKISTWTEPDYYSAVDDPEQVPNLTGVPESHSWWRKKNRELFKD